MIVGPAALCGVPEYSAAQHGQPHGTESWDCVCWRSSEKPVSEKNICRTGTVRLITACDVEARGKEESGDWDVADGEQSSPTNERRARIGGCHPSASSTLRTDRQATEHNPNVDHGKTEKKVCKERMYFCVSSTVIPRPRVNRPPANARKGDIRNGRTRASSTDRGECSCVVGPKPNQIVHRSCKKSGEVQLTPPPPTGSKPGFIRNG